MKGSPPWLFRFILVAGIVFIVLAVVPALAATTQLKVVRYAEDSTTVLNETTVTYQWMRDNLPVMGDGVTHYYHQGPVFVDDPDPAKEQDLRWNPAEDTNVQEKDMGALKGTNLKDLCDLAGGIADGETVKVKASDGFFKIFPYRNIYAYSPREGPIVVTWFVDGLKAYPSGSYPDTGYSDGMRLVWFADTSTNPWGIHAFGNYDWHEAADPEYWYYYVSGPEKYPTTTGLSMKYVSEVQLITDDSAVGDIRVTSGPPGAAISVDDTDTGVKTNGTVTGLDLGPHTVKVALEGYRDVEEKEAVVRWGVPAILHFSLIRMEGSVKVTSTPKGAMVYLDGADTKNVTPCTLNGVAPGDHIITAKLSGYADTSDTVAVEDGDTAEAELELAPLDSGSGSLSGEAASSLGNGGSLVTVLQGEVSGGVLFATTPGGPWTLERGASRTGVIQLDLPANATVTQARLLLFTAEGSSTTGAPSSQADPSVTVGDRVVVPAASYRDCRPGESSCPVIRTLAYDLHGWQSLDGGMTVTVKHPGGQAGPLTWYGAGLFVAYERKGDPGSRYWVSEGADGVLRDGDNPLPESETRTLAGFPGEMNRSLVQEAVFIPVSTVPSGSEGDGHLVSFNGNEWTSPLSGEGVRSARLDVRPYLRPAGNEAAMESAGISGKGDLLENRAGILILTYGNTTSGGEPAGTGLPAAPLPNATLTGEPAPGTTAREILVTPSLQSTLVHADNLSAEGPEISPAWEVTQAPGKESFLDQILRIISLFFLGSGEKKEDQPVGPAPPIPAVPLSPAAGDAEAQPALPGTNPSTGEEELLPCYNLTITSSPDRALVSLDGAYLSKVTPLTLTCLATGVHEVKLERDDFRDAGVKIDLRADTTLHENLSSVFPAYANLLRNYSELTDGAADRCGGVYVTSSSEKARILLDGRDTGLLTDTVLYGLKPGLHAIRIRSEKAEIPDSTLPVYVYPSVISPVNFGSAPSQNREVTVESPDLRKAEFTVNGRFPAFRIPRKVTLPSWESYITVRENGTYISYPAWAVDHNGTFIVRRQDPPALTTLQVNSDPRGADIQVDGFPTGLTTPALIHNLSQGNHQILVSSPGYLPQERAILQQDMPGDGPDTVLQFFLGSYAYGSLEMTSSPPGARIFLFQRDTGEKTPHIFPYLAIGTYDAKLEGEVDSQTLYGMTVTPFGLTSRHVNLSTG